jgi:hypothetical protein
MALHIPQYELREFLRVEQPQLPAHKETDMYVLHRSCPLRVIFHPSHHPAIKDRSADRLYARTEIKADDVPEKSFLRRHSWSFFAMFCSASLVALVVYLIIANHNQYSGAPGRDILVNPNNVQPILGAPLQPTPVPVAEPAPEHGQPSALSINDIIPDMNTTASLARRQGFPLTTPGCTPNGPVCRLGMMTFDSPGHNTAVISIYDWYCNLVGYNDDVTIGQAFNLDSQLPDVVVVEPLGVSSIVFKYDGSQYGNDWSQVYCWELPEPQFGKFEPLLHINQC